MNISFKLWCPSLMAWGGQKWPYFDYKWPNMAGLSTLGRRPKLDCLARIQFWGLLNVSLCACGAQLC